VKPAPAEGAEKPAEDAAPEMEVFYTFTWAGRAARANARPQRGNKPKGKGKRPPNKGGDQRQKFSAKPKAEKKIDPDNPFAALAALKKG
jgi:ATP-dependent RNA helicase SUPV3L1/SUV3